MIYFHIIEKFIILDSKELKSSISIRLNIRNRNYIYL